MRLVAFAMVAACGSSKPATEASIDNHAAAPVVIPPQTIDEVTFSRSACLGMCSTYSVTVHADGTVDWNGESNVAVKGEAHARIDRRVLDQLTVALDASRFFERTADGTLPPPPCAKGTICLPDITICSDTSTTTIRVKRGNVTHTVEDEHCKQDADLLTLETLIVELENLAPWIGR